MDEQVNEIHRQLGMSHVLTKYLYQMSDGEKQRVVSARAIIIKPRLILADEPIGTFDARLSKSLLESFLFLNCEHNARILMVTHDTFAASYARHITHDKPRAL